MSMMRKKSIVLLLIALLGSVAIANAASGIATCPPKECCCAPTTTAMPDHGIAMEMLDHNSPMAMELPHGCAPKKAAPCCNLEIDVQPIELAVATVSGSDAFRSLAAYLAADIHMDTPHVQNQINAYRDVGWPKIPKVPIFLQTLSILC